MYFLFISAGSTTRVFGPMAEGAAKAVLDNMVRDRYLPSERNGWDGDKKGGHVLTDKTVFIVKGEHIGFKVNAKLVE